MNRDQSATHHNESEVRKLIKDWARAISHGNRAEILAHHDDEQFLMFDFAAIERGVEAYDRTWDFFYADPTGPIQFALTEINVTAGDDVAFASCQIHCDGTSAGPLDLRLSMGLKKINGQWTILHEHHSVPTIEEKFIPTEYDAESQDRSERAITH